MASSSRQAPISPPEVDGSVQPNFEAEPNKDSQHERTARLIQHPFPVATIKKIMKADEDVRMVSADAAIFMSKACELFVQELTRKSWTHTEKRARSTLRKVDVVDAINETYYYDFLFDYRLDRPSWLKKDPVEPLAPRASEDSFFGRMIEWPVTEADDDQDQLMENVADDGVDGEMDDDGVDGEDQESDDDVEG